MDPFAKSPSRSPLSSVAILLSLVALSVALYTSVSSKRLVGNESRRPVPSILQRMRDSGKLHAGYGVYPPYTIEDPNTKAVSGFSVDLVERIAKDLKVDVVWHRVNWNTFIPDIKRGEFDLIADPILTTIPRVTEFSFTEPYDYFADGVVVLRKGETRFSVFEDLNKAGLRIAVGKGFASETVARGRLPNAILVPIQMGTDMLQLFNEVAAGRVDATLSEGPSAERYIKEHPDLVKSLNLDDPAAMIPGAFALRSDDADGARAFSIALGFLKATGEIEALRKKWGLPTSPNSSIPRHE